MLLLKSVYVSMAKEVTLKIHGAVSEDTYRGLGSARVAASFSVADDVHSVGYLDEATELLACEQLIGVVTELHS